MPNQDSSASFCQINPDSQCGLAQKETQNIPSDIVALFASATSLLSSNNNNNNNEEEEEADASPSAVTVDLTSPRNEIKGSSPSPLLSLLTEGAGNLRLVSKVTSEETAEEPASKWDFNKCVKVLKFCINQVGNLDTICRPTNAKKRKCSQADNSSQPASKRSTCEVIDYNGLMTELCKVNRLHPSKDVAVTTLTRKSPSGSMEISVNVQVSEAKEMVKEHMLCACV